MSRTASTSDQVARGIGPSEEVAADSNSGDNADTWHRRGLEAMQIGEDETALNAFRSALRLQPTHGSSYLALSEVLLRVGQTDDALVCLHRAMVCDAGPAAAARLGEALAGRGAVGRAVAAFKSALIADPSDAQSWFGLGGSLEDLGQAEAARGCYQQVLRHTPGNAPALGRLLPLLDRDETAWTRRAEAALVHPDASAKARSLVGYGLAKRYDRAGRYADAARTGRIANAARKEESAAFNERDLRQRVDAITQAYDARFFSVAPRRDDGIDVGGQPLFIVGLPRSGTTLTEQILAAHPKIHGAGELEDLPKLASELARGELPWCAAQNLSREGMSTAGVEIAARYRSALHRNASRPASELTWLIDKSPLNIFQLALPALLFPRARVIHCTRDPRDNALSIWLENFNPGQAYATDFVALAHFTAAERRLAAHWHRALPLPVLEVAYEDTVEDLEKQARRLIEFLDLSWDPRCLEFHRNTRAVQTPSRWQVRQPIYTKSVNRWERYRGLLPELEYAFAV